LKATQAKLGLQFDALPAPRFVVIEEDRDLSGVLEQSKPFSPKSLHAWDAYGRMPELRGTECVDTPLANENLCRWRGEEVAVEGHRTLNTSRAQFFNSRRLLNAAGLDEDGQVTVKIEKQKSVFGKEETISGRCQADGLDPFITKLGPKSAPLSQRIEQLTSPQAFGRLTANSPAPQILAGWRIRRWWTPQREKAPVNFDSRSIRELRLHGRWTAGRQAATPANLFEPSHSSPERETAYTSHEIDGVAVDAATEAVEAVSVRKKDQGWALVLTTLVGGRIETMCITTRKTQTQCSRNIHDWGNPVSGVGHVFLLL